MTFFYVCAKCKNVVAMGSCGKLSISPVKVYGSCCFDLDEEMKDLNYERIKRDLGSQKIVNGKLTYPSAVLDEQGGAE